ncbi:MAG: hypothetical protein AAF558_14715 [Verrucomicrobiota bacterium]
MKWILSLLAIALLAFGGWLFVQHQEEEKATSNAVTVLAPLIAYRALYEDGREREANDVLLMTVAALVEADNAGANLAEVFRRCEWENNTPTNYSDLLTDSLMRNLKIARELKLDTPENLALMKAGKSPIVGTGPYAGEKAEVDHIVPRALAPDLDNLLINLELLPMTLNRKKSNKVTDRVLSFAKQFYEAEVMLPESFEAVMEKAENVKVLFDVDG